MFNLHSYRHRLAIAGIAVLIGLPLSRAGAQAAPPGDNPPLQIQADSGIEWQQDAHLYIARGNAVAIRGPGETRADTLIAHYRPAKGGNIGGNTEIYRVEAEGHVTLKRDTQTVIGDRAVYDVDQAIAVITGSDSLEWYDQRQVAVARGDAVAVRAGKTIKGDILTAYMTKTPPAQTKAKPPVVPTTAKGGSAPAADSK